MDSMNVTGVVAGPASGQTSHTHRLRGLAGTGFIATLAAMVATTLAAALAQAVGVDFEVPEGGETIPLSGFAVVTGFFSVVGIVIAAGLLRWSARPRRAIRADGSVADRDLVGPAPPLWGKPRHHHRPPRATPRRCDGDDPHPGAEPPHPDRLMNRN
ncbi:MAG: DUF6069 family protein [Acidimicrobiales bacterium]